MAKKEKEVIEQCRYCIRSQLGNDKNGRLTMFCRLWHDRISEVYPHDRCECFCKSGSDKWGDY